MNDTDNDMRRKIVRVNFWDDRTASNRLQTERSYDYFYIGAAKAGDLAVVNVNGVFKVVRVQSVLRSSVKATKWALIVFAEDDFITRQQEAERYAEVRSELVQALKRDEVNRFIEQKVLESKDTTVRDLYAEFLELGKTFG